MEKVGDIQEIYFEDAEGTPYEDIVHARVIVDIQKRTPHTSCENVWSK